MRDAEYIQSECSQCGLGVYSSSNNGPGNVGYCSHCGYVPVINVLCEVDESGIVTRPTPCPCSWTTSAGGYCSRCGIELDSKRGGIV